MPGIPAGEHADSVYADYARLNKLDEERRYNDEERDSMKKGLDARSRALLADPFFNRTIVRFGNSKRK